VKIKKGQQISEEEKKSASYLWDSGFIVENPEISGEKPMIFSPLFNYYLEQRQISKNNGSGVELSRKENLLFTYLKGKIGIICEREEIIQAVWPEVEELGVSDWAIDRLVARLRVKLKSQDVKFEIQTVKTRGYKMVNI
jgi:DNA-binding response OmpR family regulator